jgi:PIN domain nuclease of toxin-antitoxin system
MSVFDTSAVLAILNDEDGRAVAESRLRGGSISLVNVAEVAGDYVLNGRSVPDGHEALSRLELAVHAPDAAQALRVAELRSVKNLALGDRFCIALGEALGEPLVTADQQWASLSLAVPVELIR